MIEIQIFYWVGYFTVMLFLVTVITVLFFIWWNLIIEGIITDRLKRIKFWFYMVYYAVVKTKGLKNIKTDFTIDGVRYKLIKIPKND